MDVGNKKNLSNRCIECFRFTDVCFCFVLGFFSIFIFICQIQHLVEIQKLILFAAVACCSS